MLKPTVQTAMTVAVGVMLAVVLAAQAQAQQLPAHTFNPDGFGLELVWKKSLGSGYSQIAVVDGRAITMFSDGEFDQLVALDAATGEEIWRYRIATTYRGHDGSQDGPISTPVVDDGVVYGLGRKGHLFAVSVGDGQEIWSKQINEAIGARPPEYGFATTPLIDGDVLIVQTGAAGGRSITGFHKQSGEVLWAVGNDTVGYQSPVVGTLAGQRQVVTVTNQQMMGLLPQTGEVLWSYQYGTSDLEGSSQPLFVGEDKLLLRFMREGAYGESDTALYHVTSNEKGFAVDEVWRTSAFRRSYAIPVLHDQYLYGFDGGFLTCVDPATGELVWKSRPPGGGGIRLVDGHLIIFAQQGVVAVAEATPEGYREKARLRILDHGSVQAPGFAAGRIWVRNFTDIASLRVIDMVEGATLMMDGSESPFMTSEFGAFVRSVEAADEKETLIDEFMNTHNQFPIIEGDRIIHFVYRGEVDDVVLYGSMNDDALSPDPMERIPGTDFYYTSFSAEPTTRWEYWFEINSREFIPDPLNPRRPRTKLVGWGPQNVDRSEVTMPGWVSPKHIAEPTGERGRIERFPFKSEIRGNEREVRVYLPPGYEEGQERYPLLIVNNGAEAMEYGKMDHVLDNLIGHTVAPVIVAFVAAPPGGMSREYSGSLTGEYAQLIVEELVPHLDQKYRTIALPEARAIMGTFQGAVAALYTALSHPQVFGKVAVQSPPLAFKPGGSDVLSLVRDREKQPVQFYVDWNRYDLRLGSYLTDIREDSREFAQLLRDKGYAVAGREAAESFGWASWRATTDQLLEALFPLNAER